MGARRSLLAVSLAASVAALVASPREAAARTVIETRYGFDVAWNAAIRLVRVDMGFPIVERDRETGFLLFTYRDASNHASPGSLELVPATVDGTAGVRVIVQLAQMPAYLERMMINQLDRKLHTEYGEPPPPNNVRREPTPPGIGNMPREPERDRDRDRDRPREGGSDRDRPREGGSDRDRPREGESERDRPREVVRPSERNETQRNANGE